MLISKFIRCLTTTIQLVAIRIYIIQNACSSHDMEQFAGNVTTLKGENEKEKEELLPLEWE